MTTRAYILIEEFTRGCPGGPQDLKRKLGERRWALIDYYAGGAVRFYKTADAAREAGQAALVRRNGPATGYRVLEADAPTTKADLVDPAALLDRAQSEMA